MKGAKMLIDLPDTQGGRLALLTAMPWSRYEDPEGALVHLLRREMVDGVVVLAPCAEIRPAAGKDLLRWYRRQGFEPLHLPFALDEAPPLDRLQSALATLRGWLHQDRRVVLHGHRETQRPVFFAAAWLIVGETWPLAQALAWVAEHLPLSRPLSPAQRAALHRLAASQK